MESSLSTTVSIIMWIVIALCIIGILLVSVFIILNSMNKLIKKSPPPPTNSSGVAYFYPNQERYGTTQYTDAEKAAALAEYREQMRSYQGQNAAAAANFNASNKLF